MKFFTKLTIAFAVAIALLAARFPAVADAGSPQVQVSPVPTLAAPPCIDCVPQATATVQTETRYENVQVRVPVRVERETVQVPGPTQVVTQYVEVPGPTQYVQAPPVCPGPQCVVQAAPTQLLTTQAYVPTVEVKTKRPGFLNRLKAAANAPKRQVVKPGVAAVPVTTAVQVQAVPQVQVETAPPQYLGQEAE